MADAESNKETAGLPGDPGFREFFAGFVDCARGLGPGPLGRLSSSIGHGEGAVIKELYRKEEGMSPGDISKKLDFASNRVANALKRLYEKGYVESKEDEGDHRKRIVYLTEEGKNFASELREAVIESCRHVYLALGEEDAFRFLRILRKLAEYRKVEENGD